MEPMNASRRNFLRLVGLGVPVSVALAACGGSPTKTGAGGSSGGGKGVATYWTLSGKPQEDIRNDTVARFNKANPKSKIDVTLFANDAYKQKVKTAIGAGKGPTLIWGWGGGGLKSYVEADQVMDLTSWFDDNPDLKEKRFPATFEAATVNGKLYALPIETVTPIVLYWNKKLFDQVGAEPPQSWGDIMDLVPKFNAKGIAPFSLAGQSLWTNMMWLEFLFDRIGGPDVFGNVFDGQKGAWSNPAALKALGDAQTLVKANGFQKGFQSTVADQNADQALLFTGKAAMMVHGAWTYGSMKADGGDFVTGGNLGYMNFPPVDGGEGDAVGHGRKPWPVCLHLLQGQLGGGGCGQEDAHDDDARRHRGQEVGRQRQHPGGEERGRPDLWRLRRERQAMAAVRLRHLQQGLGLRSVLGPGAAAQPGHPVAGQHRQALPAEHQPPAVR